MNDSRTIIDRSRRHYAAETAAQTVRLPGQSIGHFAGGSVSFLLATVIRGLLYPDAARTEGPVEGYSQYILRISGVTYTAWSDAGVSYVIGNLRSHEGLLYACTTDHTSSSFTEPGTAGGADYWGLSTEIAALPSGQETVLGTDAGTYYAATPDMRHFTPWFKTGAIVRLELRDGFYFFAETMMRVVAIDDATQSIRWNDTKDRGMGVFA